MKWPPRNHITKENEIYCITISNTVLRYQILYYDIKYEQFQILTNQSHETNRLNILILFS